MKRFVAMMTMAWALVAAPAEARAADDTGMRASTPETKKELVEVVEAQLAAFRQEDVAKAYGLASRALRAQRPLRMFSAIIEANYPEIWANTRAEFGIAYDDGARARIAVVVHDAEDRATFDYMLVRERAGWRIEGVLRRTKGKGSKV
jgi:hypothetical protein